MSDEFRIAIGTAQFGLDYGITNTRGQVPGDEVELILQTAERYGIDTLDTAAAYGDAESVLGEYKGLGRFRVVTKISPETAGDVDGDLRRSRDRLRADILDTVLVHDTEMVLAHPEIWRALATRRRAGTVRRIGISVYWPRQWYEFVAMCTRDGLSLPEMIQLPMSVFDQRFVPILTHLKSRSVEIHVRSVYLQGAVFFNSSSISPGLAALSAKIEALQEIEDWYSVSRAAVCIAFALLHPEIDRIVVGIDGLSRLDETIFAFREAASLVNSGRLGDGSTFDRLRVDDESIILPFNWRNF